MGIIASTANIVLPHAIKVLKAKGYELVTLAECMGMDAYQSVSAPQSVSFVRFLLLLLYLMHCIQGSWTC